MMNQFKAKFWLLALALALCPLLTQATIHYGPALIGPNFKDQPWLGQPGYDNPGPAPEYRPPPRVVYEPLHPQTANNKETETKPQIKQEATDATQTQQANQQGSKKPQPTTAQSESQPQSDQFGTVRPGLSYQPGSAQLYFQRAGGKMPKENYNEQRYKQIPSYIRSRPGWQDGFFVSKPSAKQQSAGKVGSE